MKSSIGFFVLFIQYVSVAAVPLQTGHVALYDLRCEHLGNPIQIDAPKPRLSWKLKATNPSVRDIHQSAYHLLVASRPELLEKDVGDLWDSGRIASGQSVLVAYQGSGLESRQKCFWKVRAWDRQGQPTPWSETAHWQMALLKADDWSPSEWIGLDRDTRASEYAARMFATEKTKTPLLKKSYPSPLLRKEISIGKPVRQALAYVSGVGYCELYINGKKVGDQLLDPGQTSYDKHTLYVTHDISALIQQGSNALGLWLGNGFYGQNVAFNSSLGYGQPRVRATFFIEYQDGTQDTVSTGTDWKTTVSPIVFDNVYGGESYDARLEIKDWCKPGFDDSAWQQAKPLDAPCPDTCLRSQLLPPIRAIQRLAPVASKPIGDGKYLVDFGKNIAGWVGIRVRQKAGDVIRIKLGEAVAADGESVNTESTGHFATGLVQELFYICKGGGSEMWEPRFTYHGFRYAEISGLREPPTAESVTGVLVHSDLPRTGDFSCSDPMLSAQYETSLLTFKDNWHSIPEDCPHREKCGWLGDAHATADASMYSYDMSRFYTKYLLDIEDNLVSDRRLEKVVPHAAGVPTMVAPGKRAASLARIDWGVASVLVPWRMYLHTGDRGVFRQHYPDMKNFIAYFFTYQDADGTITNGMGDWCPPRWDRKDAPQFMECHPYVSGTAFFYETLQIVGKMAAQFNDPEYSQWCFDRAAEIKAAFNKAYLKPIPCTTLRHYGSQTATVMALKFGMVFEQDKDNVIEALIYDIKSLHDGHHACGIHGLRHLYTVLTENGQDELAYKMLTDTTFPGPAYIIDCGLTTWPERQWEWNRLPEWERSLNHPMQGGFTAFMHESLGGIQPSFEAAGYRKFVLKPRLTDQLGWVKTSMESPHGTIRSEWKNEPAKFSWTITVPANSSAEVYFPFGAGKQISEGGEPFAPPCRQIVEDAKVWSVCLIGSGTYHFSITK